MLDSFYGIIANASLTEVIAPVSQGIGTVGVLAYVANYFMRRTEKLHDQHQESTSRIHAEYREDIAARNRVIENLVTQSNLAIKNNTEALAGLLVIVTRCEKNQAGSV